MEATMWLKSVLLHLVGWVLFWEGGG